MTTKMKTDEVVELMHDKNKQLERLTEALAWAMPYAERAHESEYPGETFERDHYVARSVAEAREVLRVALIFQDHRKRFWNKQPFETTVKV